jgi:hypothetical protein
VREDGNVQTLYSDEYSRVEVDVSHRFVRFTRTAVPLATPESAETAYLDAAIAIDALERPIYVVLVDLRLARGSNTPGFEEAMARGRKRLLGGFRKTAVLVRTAAGALQVQRHAREDASNTQVFQDETSALTFLRAEGDSSAG